MCNLYLTTHQRCELPPPLSSDADISREPWCPEYAQPRSTLSMYTKLNAIFMLLATFVLWEPHLNVQDSHCITLDLQESCPHSRNVSQRLLMHLFLIPRLEVTPVRGCKLESTLNATTYNSIKVSDITQCGRRLRDKTKKIAIYTKMPMPPSIKWPTHRFTLIPLMTCPQNHISQDQHWPVDHAFASWLTIHTIIKRPSPKCLVSSIRGDY